MAEIGQMNRLKILREVEFGLYLDGQDLGDILLPIRYVPEGWALDDMLDVFIYRDSEDRLIATTEKPLAYAESCAYLRVASTSSIGAFLDWGLPKDLLVPFREQRHPMKVGESYVVFVFVNDDGRLVASSKLSQFLYEDNDKEFDAGEAVELLIAERSDLGFKAVIEDSHLGLIAHEDVYAPVRIGQRLRGYIKNFRADGKINLTLRPRGQNGVDDVCAKIYTYLKTNGGELYVTDRSSPEEIKALFATSKATYKKALGKLYKEKRISLTPERITWVK